MKKTQLDKAIDVLEGEKAVLELALAKLRAQQQTPKPARTRKARPVTADVQRAS